MTLTMSNKLQPTQRVCSRHTSSFPNRQITAWLRKWRHKLANERIQIAENSAIVRTTRSTAIYLQPPNTRELNFSFWLITMFRQYFAICSRPAMLIRKCIFTAIDEKKRRLNCRLRGERFVVKEKVRQWHVKTKREKQKSRRNRSMWRKGGWHHSKKNETKPRINITCAIWHALDLIRNTKMMCHFQAFPFHSIVAASVSYNRYLLFRLPTDIHTSARTPDSTKQQPQNPPNNF